MTMLPRPNGGHARAMPGIIWTWLVIICAGVPVRDELGGVLMLDAERTPKCCLCPMSKWATAEQCGLVKSTVLIQRDKKRWKEDSCRDKLCRAENVDGKCAKTCLRHILPWMPWSRKLQTKPWQTGDPMRWAVGTTKAACTDQKTVARVPTRCRWLGIKPEWTKLIVKERPMEAAQVRRIYASEVGTLKNKLRQTFSLTMQEFRSMIGGQMLIRMRQPALQDGDYVVPMNKDDKLAAGGGGQIWRVHDYRPLPRYTPSPTYQGQDQPDLIVKDELEYMFAAKFVVDMVREAHMQRSCRALMQSVDTSIADLVLPAWLLIAPSRGKSLIGPAMPRLPYTLSHITERGLYGMPDEVPPVAALPDGTNKIDMYAAAGAGRPDSRSRIGAVAQQLFLFLAIAHGSGISHNDIKPGNILCLFSRHGGWPQRKGDWPRREILLERAASEPPRKRLSEAIPRAIEDVGRHGVNIAVIDFGLTGIHVQRRGNDASGTPGYTPPFLFNSNYVETGMQVDVWSACVVVGTMLWGEDNGKVTGKSVPTKSGAWPFRNVGLQRTRRRSERERAGVPLETQDPPQTLEELVHRCLNPNAHLRPKALQVLEWLTTRGPPSVWETQPEINRWRGAEARA